MPSDDNDPLNHHSSEAEGLLSHPDEYELSPQIPFSPNPNDTKPSRPRHTQRQSSLSHPRPNGTPRTSNRVRFAAEIQTHSPATIPSPSTPGWLEEEDYLQSPSDEQHSRLLPDITPPSASPFLSDDFQPEDHLPNARPRSSLPSAFMNMANSIIGAGIIGQPYALRQAGLVTGVVLLCALTVIVDWTIRLIVINSKLSATDSFQATVQHCFGRVGLLVISMAQWAFAFGGMVAFCVIIGDTVPRVVRGLFPGIVDLRFLWLLANRRAVIVMAVGGVSLPLSLYRDIAKLAKASTLALISMLIIIVTVVVNGPMVDKDLRGNLDGLLFINDGFFQAVGVISFAFVCHHNSLLIYTSISTPSIDRFSRVTHFSTFVSLLACLTMSLSGLLTFGSLTTGNVLNNFPSSSNISIQIARLCFGLNMLTTLPLEAFVCREVMLTFFWPNAPHNVVRHVVISSLTVLAAMGVSLVTCDLGVVFELVGATSACVLAYILPPACHVKLAKRGWRTAPAVACIVFGFGVLGVSVVQSVVKIARRGGDTAQCV